MVNQEYQICQRCVMDTTDPDISFNEDGYCNHCTNYIENILPLTYQPNVSEKQWDSILKDIKRKGKGKKYDCLVGISGGVDSSYVAHLCKEYELRPLLMHFDNGWNTEMSIENVNKIAKQLNFDLINIEIDWEEFKEIQLAFLRSSIVDFEMPTDLGILGANYQTAAKYDITTILSGGNFTSEGILPLQWGYHVMNDMKLYRHIVKHYGNVNLKNVPVAGFKENFFYKFIKKIKTFYPLNYIDYNKDKAKQLLIDNYGFGNYGGKHQESQITAFWQTYVMPIKYNMDYRKATLSSQICSNQVTRDEALAVLKLPPYGKENLEVDKLNISEKLGISIEELESYLYSNPKTYVNFPNQKNQIQFFYKIYGQLKKLTS